MALTRHRARKPWRGATCALAVAVTGCFLKTSFGQCQYELIMAPTLTDGISTYGLIPVSIGEDGVVAGSINFFPRVPAYWDGGDTFFILPEPPGQNDGLVLDILNRDAMVGRAGSNPPLFWRNGQLEILPWPIRIERAFALALNNKLQIIGEAAGLNVHGEYQGIIPVLWDEGVYIELETIPGGSSTGPRVINNHGLIAGYTRQPPDYVDQLVTWRDGSLAVHGSMYAGILLRPGGINDRGLIVGSDWDTIRDASRPFVWQNGQFHVLPTPSGGLSAAANDISDTGQIVGFASVPGSGLRAMLWQGSNRYDLNDLAVNVGSAVIEIGVGINNLGMMAVSAGTGNGMLVPLGSMPADINTDCVVSVPDLLLLLGAWGEINSFADLDGSGIVDVPDLILLLEHWGESNVP